MPPIVFGYVRSYANSRSDTAPGDVVVTKYDKSGKPIKKEFYKVYAPKVQAYELYEQKGVIDPITNEEKVFNAAETNNNSFVKLEKVELIDETQKETSRSKSNSHEFDSFSAAMKFAKNAAIETKIVHNITSQNNKWYVESKSGKKSR